MRDGIEKAVDIGEKAYEEGSRLYRIPLIGKAVRWLGQGIKRQLIRGRARRIARRKKRRG